MHASLQRWLRSMKSSFRGRLAEWSDRAPKSPVFKKCETLLGLEPLEDRSMLAMTAGVNGAGVLEFTTDSQDSAQISASGGVVTVVGSASINGGGNTVSYNLTDFTEIVFHTNSNPNFVFGNVEVVGSAEFAAEDLYVYAVSLQLTGGALSVNDVQFVAQGSNSSVVVDQAITAAGNVALIPLAANVVVNAPITAGGTVSLISGFAVRLGGVSQSAAGVVTANELIVNGGANGGVDLSAAANKVGILSGDVTFGASPFKFNNALDLTIKDAGGGVGVQTLDGDVSISVAAGKTLTLNGGIKAQGTGRTATLVSDNPLLNSANSLVADDVVIRTAGAAVDYTLGSGVFTDAVLDRIQAKNLTFDASGRVQVFGDVNLGDTVSEVVTLKGADYVYVSQKLTASGAANVLRFESNNFFFNTSDSKLISAPTVEFATQQSFALTASPGAVPGGYVQFTQGGLNTLNEDVVQTVRFDAAGNVAFTSGLFTFANGSVLKAGGAAALRAGADFSQIGGGVVTAEKLSVVAGGSVSLNAAGNSVGILSGYAGTGQFQLTSNKAMQIGSVDDAALGVVRGIGATGITASTHADLRSGGALTQTAVGKVTAFGLLAMGTTIDLSTATNSVRQFAAAASGAGAAAGDVRYKNGGLSLDVTTVNGVSGVQAAAAPGAPATLGNVTIVNDADVLVVQSIQNGAGGQAGTVRLTSSAGAVGQDVGGVIRAKALGVQTAGAIALDVATNGVDAFAARNASGDLRIRSDAPSGTLTIGSVAADGALFATTTGLASDVATDVRITTTADQLDVAAAIQTTAGGRMNSVLITASSPTAGGVGQSAVIRADKLGVYAYGAVALDAVVNDVNTVALVNESANPIAFRNDSGGTLTLGVVGGLFGARSGAVGTNVTITTADDLVVDQPIASAGGRMGTVLLTSVDGAVSQSSGAGIQADALGVEAEGAVTLSSGNDVGTLAVHNDTAAGVFFLGGGNPLTIGTVGALSGITSDAAATTVTVTNFASISIAQSIQKSGGGRLAQVLVASTNGDVNQTAGGAIAADALAVQALGSGTLGRIDLSAATNDVSTLAMKSNTAFGMYFNNDSGGTLTIGTVGTVSGITSTVGSAIVGIKTADDLVVDKAIQLAGGGRLNVVGLNSLDGAVSQSATGKIEAGSLAVLAETNILLDVATNNVLTLAMDADAAGAMNFKNDSALLSIGSVGLLNVGTASGIASDSAAAKVSVANSGDVLVGFPIQKSGGGRLDTVLLTSADGAVSQLAGGKIEADALGVQAETNITLDAATNDVLTLALRADGAGAMKFANDSGAALTIGTVGTLSGITSASSGASAVVATADDLVVAQAIQLDGGGRLLQAQLTSLDGSITQTAAGVVRAASLAVQAQTNVLLDATDNDVDLLAMDNDAAGSLAFKNASAGGLRIGATGGLTGITSDSGATNVDVSSAFGIDVSGPIQRAGGGRLNTVLLRASNRDVSQEAGGKIEAAALGVHAQNAITLDVEANDVLTLAMDNAGAYAMKFKNDSGATLTIGTVGAASGIRSTSAGATASVVTADDLALQQAVQTTAGGRLAQALLTSVDGSITQTATGKISADALGASAAENISLDAASNDVLTLAMRTQSASAMDFDNDSGATLVVGTVGGLVGVQSLSGGARAAVRTADDLEVQQAIGTNQPTVLLDQVLLTSVDGVVRQTAGGVVSAAALGVQAQTDVFLDVAANVVTTLAMENDAAGAMRFKTQNPSAAGLEIGAVGALVGVQSDSADSTVAVTALGPLVLRQSIQKSDGSRLAQVELVASGAAGELAGAKIAAAALGVKADGGASFASSGNDVGTLAAAVVGGDVTVVDGGAGLTIGTVDMSASLGAGASLAGVVSGSAATAVAVTAAGALAVDASIQTTAGGPLASVDLESTAAGFEQKSGSILAAVLTASGAASFDQKAGAAASGDVVSFKGGAGGATIAGAVAGTTSVKLESGGALSVSGSVGTKSADVDATGLISIDGSLTASTLADLDAGGGIAVAGLLDATGGTADLKTTAGGVAVDAAGALKGGALVVDSAAGISIDGTATAETTADLAAAGGFTLAGDLSAGTAATLGSGGGFTLSGGLTAPVAKVSSGAGLSVAGTVVAVQSAELDAVNGIDVGGDVATYKLAATAGDDVAVSGRIDVGLGDAKITAGGSVVLQAGGILGLVVASPVDYTDFSITAAAVDLSQGAIDLNFLDAPGTIPSLAGRQLVLVTSNVADVGVPAIDFFDAGAPAAVISADPNLPSVVLGGQVVTFVATFGSRIVLALLPIPETPPAPALTINTPLTVPAPAINVPPPIPQTTPALETDFFTGEQNDLASLTVYLKLYRLVAGKKEWVLGRAEVDETGATIEKADSFKGSEVLSKLLAVFTDVISGKWGVYTLELEEVAARNDGQEDAPKATRTVKATFVFNVKTQQELIQAIRSIHTIETLFQYFQELPHRTAPPPAPDSGETGGPAARRERPAPPAQGEGASFFDALRDRSSATAQLLREDVAREAEEAGSAEGTAPPPAAAAAAGAVAAGTAAIAGFRSLRRDDRFEQELDSLMQLFEAFPDRWN